VCFFIGLCSDWPEWKDGEGQKNAQKAMDRAEEFLGGTDDTTHQIFFFKLGADVRSRIASASSHKLTSVLSSGLNELKQLIYIAPRFSMTLITESIFI
jgi:hypothetical protein